MQIYKHLTETKLFQQTLARFKKVVTKVTCGTEEILLLCSGSNLLVVRFANVAKITDVSNH